MKPSLARRNEAAAALLDLLASVAGFGAVWAAAPWLAQGSLGGPWEFQWAFSAIIAWFAIVLPDSSSREGLRRWVDGFFTATGSNLLIQYGLAYLFGIPATPWLLIVGGSALSLVAAGVLGWIAPVARGGARNGALLIGFDSCTRSVAAALEGGAVGILDQAPAAGPETWPRLGAPEQVREVCEIQHPGSIVVTGKPVGVSLAQLLQLHYAGIEVDGAPFVCERVLRRVAWQHLSPSELLFSVTPITSRALLAFQAVYKNAAGIPLLVLFAPLLILISLAIVLSSGVPVLERVECLGFQRIPFQLFRFRIARRDGRPFWIGSLIARWRLAGLPQLINIFRGEVSLFGPRPVRAVFAERFEQLLPAYVYRFTVKPGIFGWAQAHLAETGGVPEETLSLEYDLYYIRQESPSLDLDILVRTLSRRSQAAPDQPGVPETAGS